MNYIDTLSELDKYKSTHPIFVELWTKYINGKKNTYEKSLKTCSTLFPKLKDINDKDIETVLVFYYLQLLLK